MSGQILARGRAATLRRLLLDFPAGATSAELRVAGNFEAPAKYISDDLSQMRTSGHVTVEMEGKRRVYRLAPGMRELMSRIDYTEQQRIAAIARKVQTACHKPPANDAYAMTTEQRKRIESQEIDRLMADYLARGGQIERLGNTPLRKGPSYRSSQSGIARAAAKA